MPAFLQSAVGEPLRLAWLWTNLVPVIAGNLVGGSVMALVYHVIYRHPGRT